MIEDRLEDTRTLALLFYLVGVENGERFDIGNGLNVLMESKAGDPRK